MALTDCPDCGNQISTEAYACPKCGRPTARHKSVKTVMIRGIVLWLVVVLSLLTIWNLLGK